MNIYFAHCACDFETELEYNLMMEIESIFGDNVFHPNGGYDCLEETLEDNKIDILLFLPDENGFADTNAYNNVQEALSKGIQSYMIDYKEGASLVSPIQSGTYDFRSDTGDFIITDKWSPIASILTAQKVVNKRLLLIL